MLSSVSKSLIILSALLSFAPSAFAGAVTFVSTCGDDAWGGNGSDCNSPHLSLRPKRTIQAAIAISNSVGGEVVVLPGTYNERINFIGKGLRIRSVGGPAVTTIDATGLPGSAVVLDIVPASTPVLDGFTVTGGTGEVLPGFGNLRGGGLRISGGITADIINCIFRNNNVGQTCCTLGGGIYVENGALPRIVNCVMHDNSPHGLHGYLGTPTIINCTVSANNTYGIVVQSTGVWIHNTISWGNPGGNIAQVGATPFYIYNSCYAGSSGTNGNTGANPLFVNPLGKDFRLQTGSPAIDTGNDAVFPTGLTSNDVAGLSRFVNGNATPAATVDMGAHEFRVETCPADVEPAGGNGSININDLLMVINAWGPCPQPCAWCAPDTDNDCDVDINDLLAVINAWGQCP